MKRDSTYPTNDSIPQAPAICNRGSRAFLIVCVDSPDIGKLTADGMGQYDKHGGHWEYYNVVFANDQLDEKLTKNAEKRDKTSAYGVYRYTSYHKSNQFVRIIMIARKPNGNFVKRAIIQYKFEDEDRSEVQLMQHGNAKHAGPYVKTDRTVLETLDRELKTKPPSVAMHKVNRAGDEDAISKISEFGGGSVVRNSMQARNRKRNVPDAPNFRRGSGNPPFDLVNAQLYLRGLRNSGVRYAVQEDGECIRIMVGTDYQIEALKTYCSSNSVLPMKTVAQFDTTFDCGPMFVTYFVIENKNFVDARTTKIFKTCLMPAMLHTHRRAEDFRAFAAWLKDLGIQKVRIEILLLYCIALCFSFKLNVGSDRDKAGVKGFAEVYPLSENKHMFCSIHVRKNVTEAANAAGVQSPSDCATRILGKFEDGRRIIGVVDSETEEEVRVKVEACRRIWGDEFMEYYYKSLHNDIIQGMLAPARRQVGLGTGGNFENNRSESFHAKLKAYGGNKRKGPGELLREYIEICKNEQEEMKMAVFQLGDYRLSIYAEHLEIDVNAFMRMSQERKNELFGRLHLVPLKTADLLPNDIDQNANERGKKLSIQWNEVQIPVGTETEKRAVWKAAEVLLNVYEKPVLHLAGNENAKVVVDCEDTFKVTVTGQKFICSRSCEQYDQLHFCQHTLLAAESCNHLVDYLGYLCELNPVTEFERKVTENLPKSVGRKGEKSRRWFGPKKSATKSCERSSNLKFRSSSELGMCKEPNCNLCHSAPYVFTEPWHNNNKFRVLSLKVRKCAKFS